MKSFIKTVLILSLSFSMYAFSCGEKYTFTETEDGITPDETVEVDNNLGVYIKRQAVQALGSVQIQLSLERVGILVDRVSLFQGIGNQELDIYNSYIAAGYGFQELAAGDKWDIVELDVLPDGNYTHLYAGLAGLQMTLPVKMHLESPLNAGTSGDGSLPEGYYYGNIEVVYYFESYDFDAGEIELTVHIDGHEPIELGSYDPNILFEGQDQAPVASFLMELDDSIRVNQNVFGAHQLGLGFNLNDSLTFVDTNENGSIDMVVDGPGEQPIVEFSESLDFFPNFSIELNEQIAENVDFASLGIEEIY